MADSIVRLRVDSQEYDNKLKRAAEGLNRYIEGCRKAGGTLEHVDDGVKEFTQELGKMGTVAGGAKGKLGEMTKAFTDLTLQFNQMTEAEKRGQFGKALSSGLDELKQRIISTKKELADINNSLNGGGAPSAGGLFGGGKLDGMLQVLGGNLMTKGVSVLAGFASEMGDMVKQGIELARQGEGIRIAFERLNKPGLLDNLREATHGTLTNLELMKAAVQFNDFKLPLEELGTMLAFAQQKAKDTGQSVDYMAQSIVTGLGRKSVMILDNLGLSAAEIKEKMKDTGDMTKAVGEIIREQMAKAGDYVETAADRASKANVSLQNKMEELGRKFGPLEQASSNLWTSIKIGIMDIVGGPLTEFINKLTEAGRLAQQYGVLGGTGKVGRMINNLSGAREGNRQSVYQQQQEQFWRYINPREQQIKDIRAWQRGERGEALQKRVSAITDKYGSLDATKIQAEVDAAKKMLNEYIQGAKAILEGNPVPSPTSTTTTTPTGGASSNTSTTTTKQPKTEIEQNQAKIKELTQEYIKLGDQETEASKNRQIEIQKEIELLQKRNNLLGVRAEQAQGKFLGGDVQTAGLSPAGYIIDRSHLFDTEGGINWQKLQKYNEQTSVAEYKRRRKEWESEEKNKNKNKKNSEYDKDDSAVSQLLKLNEGVAGMAKGLEQMGIELPEGFNSVINGIQGVLSMLESINTIVAAIKGLKEVGTFLGIFSHGGTVRAAQGYYVPGTHASGDVTPILANAGELVLNKSSQDNLALGIKNAEALVQTIDRYQTSIMRGSQYNYGTPTIGGGMLGNMKLETMITGEQIRLVLNNNGRRTGRGEYITTNFK